MTTTITIRMDETLRRQIEERAAAQGKSLSETVREILEAAITPRPLGCRVGHLRGGLALAQKDADPMRRELRERNWRR